MKVLDEVRGVEDRTNTVVYSPPQDDVNIPCQSLGHVVYFPGDIQDFNESMSQRPSCRKYVAWSYEATISILSQRFPFSHVWLISSSRKTFQSICIYQNFVQSESILGIPSHSTDFNGLRHLELLLSNASQQLCITPALLSPVKLIGFSKGCVVLNQFLYELSAYGNSHVVEPGFFVKGITEMIWLDGGHSGEKNVWVTDPHVIAVLSLPMFKHIKFSIHVTPYQVRDEHRPWKGEAKARFIELLQQNNLDFNDTLYFEDELATIDIHFKILICFNNSV